MNSAHELLQQSNMLSISREVTRIRENNHGIKSLLAASNDEGRLTTLSPTIVQKQDKWRCRTTQRKYHNSIRGIGKYSATYSKK